MKQKPARLSESRRASANPFWADKLFESLMLCGRKPVLKSFPAVFPLGILFCALAF
jgi:hypothetical protein